MSYNLQRYIPRRIAVDLEESLNNFPITALLGPLQCGKSTLAKHIDTVFNGGWILYVAF